MLKLLALLAGRAGGLLVPAALASQSGIPRTTLMRYLELLSSVFLIKTIPAWSSGQTQRAVGTPKLAFVDTGVACHLIGQDADWLGEPGGFAGPMMENLVAMELARQLTWPEERGRLYHYRTKDKLEVDAVIETPDGRVNRAMRGGRRRSSLPPALHPRGSQRREAANRFVRDRQPTCASAAPGSALPLTGLRDVVQPDTLRHTTLRSSVTSESTRRWNSSRAAGLVAARRM
ncbi:MAG: DUF4143 domain-containing protein [Pseudonocardiaceae bacterium]